jgi:hypothetical protein
MNVLRWRQHLQIRAGPGRALATMTQTFMVRDLRRSRLPTVNGTAAAGPSRPAPGPGTPGTPTRAHWPGSSESGPGAGARRWSVTPGPRARRPGLGPVATTVRQPEWPNWAAPRKDDSDHRMLRVCHAPGRAEPRVTVTSGPSTLYGFICKLPRKVMQQCS